VLALFPLMIWTYFARRKITIQRAHFWAGLVLGTCFGVEFLMLFMALDLTSVARSAILFYSMPIWLAIATHFLLPDERMTPTKALGLVVSMAGVMWALVDRGLAQGNLLGDLLALGAAFGWAGVALTVRVTRLAQTTAETQLFWQLAVSAPILLICAMFAGPLLRAPTMWHWVGLVSQSLVVACAMFLWWFYMMLKYKANAVASFSFLAPALSVMLGTFLLGEDTSPAIWAALALILAGIWLINRRPKAPAS
jgi:drug/metabolite transporter (DMT)-like permease